MYTVRGKALALALLAVTSAIGTFSMTGSSGTDEAHEPIFIDEASDFTIPSATTGCQCVRSGAGTSLNPYIIEDWRIENTTGTAIAIENITSVSFIIRDSTLSGWAPVRLINTGDRGQLIDNTITFTDIGVYLLHSSTTVDDNIIQMSNQADYRHEKIGVSLKGGSPIIRNNLITRPIQGIKATGSSPTIEGNEIIEAYDAIILDGGAEARIESNTLRLSTHWGLVVRQSARATLLSNEVREGRGGIIVQNADLYMESNTVFNQRDDAVYFQRASVTMLRNTITDNFRGAFGSQDSDVLMIENVFRNNDDAGIYLVRSEGNVSGNIVEANEVGIAVHDSSITLRNNQLANNTHGFSLPYSSKLSINQMYGNIVNGRNVDGTIRPSEQVIFYNDGGFVINDTRFDASHGTYTGTLTAQGAVIIYDSRNVTVENSSFAFNDVAIHVQSSFVVRIRNNSFESNLKAVVSVDSRTFIKDNECEIEVDPEETVCFDVLGGFTVINNNTIRGDLSLGVDVGIRLGISAQGSARGLVINNTVKHTTKAGIELHGDYDQHEHDVLVANNRIEANVVGMVLVRFRGTVEANVIANNTWAGVHLESSTNATFVENHITLNARGVVDVGRSCEDRGARCSSGVFLRNRVVANTHVGIEVDGGATFDGDVVVRNKIGLDIQGDAVLRGVRVTANAGVGVRGEGRISVQESNVSANGGVGVEVTGHLHTRDTNTSDNGDDGVQASGRIRLHGHVALHNDGDGVQAEGRGRVHAGNFSHNSQVGLRFTGTLYTVADCEASFNVHGIVMIESIVDVDLPSLEIDIQPPDPTDDEDEERDPLFVHGCNIAHNNRFALQASVNTVVNATLNFWGEAATYANPVLEGHNVISNHALVSPYYTDRTHTQRGFMPGVEGGPEPLV